MLFLERLPLLDIVEDGAFKARAEFNCFLQLKIRSLVNKFFQFTQYEWQYSHEFRALRSSSGQTSRRFVQVGSSPICKYLLRTKTLIHCDHDRCRRWFLLSVTARDAPYE